jgi:hypothetical protein
MEQKKGAKRIFFAWVRATGKSPFPEPVSLSFLFSEVIAQKKIKLLP